MIETLHKWFESIGIGVAAPALQLSFLYSVLGIVLGLYLLARFASAVTLNAFLKLRSRVKLLEKQMLKLAAENLQQREQLLRVYDYLIQFEKAKNAKAQEDPIVLSQALPRESLAIHGDFEVVVDDEEEPQQQRRFCPTIRRFSRSELAKQAGLDMEFDPLLSAKHVERAPRRESVSLPEPIMPPAEALPSAKSIFAGLTKTRSELAARLSNLWRSRQTDSERYEALEELLLTSDLGVRTTQQMIENLKREISNTENVTEDMLRGKLKSGVLRILDSDQPPEIIPERRGTDPLVVLVVGVNGVGKTTTIGKLSWQFRAQGARVLVAACDTFRAAAVEQLTVWTERAGVDVVSGGENAKPSTVAYEAIHRGRSEGYDVVIIDTAGRLHTRANLMNELSNVVRIVEREQPGAPHETILVVDAATGQNALQQAIEFNQRARLTGIIITKLDGTSKGGILVAIKNELNVPIRYVGIGEGVTDLKLFSAQEFTDALFGEGEELLQTAGASAMA